MTQSIESIYHEIIRRRMWIGLGGITGLEVGPSEIIEADAEFLAELRSHRGGLLEFLDAGRHIPILVTLARQITATEFDGCDDEAREALIENLRQDDSIFCREALEHLQLRK
jgi:hypothetical protein